MDKIPSFEKDHDLLQPGLHFSTLQKGVMTLDMRCKRPNAGDFISPAALHSIEHMLATALRSGPQKEHILYFGPMGCRTGFYLLTEGLSYRAAADALRAALDACMGMNEVPGALRKECGNYLEHDLAGAKRELAAYIEQLGGLPAGVWREEEARAEAAFAAAQASATQSKEAQA